MTDKNLVNLNIDSLERKTSEQLQTQEVTAVILALGSNYNPKQHLLTVRNSLADLGAIQPSTAFQNPDFTATLDQPKPDYTNQCIYLSLTNPITLQELESIFKQFECDCNRQRQDERTGIKQVTIDIDILLIILINDDKWIVMVDRYPFKAHESTGMSELMVNGL